MFQYIVSVFRKAGAHNVLWAFCPNAESVPNTSYNKSASWNIIKNYYPGDDYVDIFGIDGYNWGTTQKKESHGWDSHWRSFSEIFQSARNELLLISPKKDIIVFETATVNQGGNKTFWIKDMLVTSQKWGLTGIVWFQFSKEQDWRLNSSGDSDYLKIIRSIRSPSQEWIKNMVKERAR
jgi:beta-mannanase